MKHVDDVFRYAMSRMGQREEAEDVAMEVVQALPNPCYRRDLRVYMIGMARRKIADRLRRRHPVNEIRESEAASRFDHASDEAAMVARTMSSLSPEHREALAMKYVVGLSSAEIGAAMGKRPEAVDSLMQRARDAFAREWTRTSSDEVNL
ncbi:RNA polymerase sigma factor [Fimbriimonas ginsengisoli]|uniref:RNA polymerase sigma factor, sigma-70 family protein n=1 Tax=Fimbriimonas ginsengisoli Gsoil 348 TaxID=661478 RepID=A0A068NST5_FIMGI|nr:RNA polymerase sigma factor [Fimbriimonas ginsengisoli]AIE84679.1 RNA polymerase sigma factor, sigma-70 family protein [Fimbriimonas ginsengisoli Gsoil 348]